MRGYIDRVHERGTACTKRSMRGWRLWVVQRGSIVRRVGTLAMSKTPSTNEGSLALDNRSTNAW